MSSVVFTKATKTSARLRMALAGPAGSGKTYTALTLAQYIAQGGRVAVIDTERGSASKYADRFDFDALELESYHPQRYIDAIAAAGAAGYAVLVIDSLSHAWMGRDGALELVDRAAKRSQSGNSFGAWREVTPLHNALVDAMIGAPLHLIATLRSKTDYVQERDDRGRTVVRKVGLAPVQRDGLEYEFDVYGDLTHDNTLLVGKTRCAELTGAVIEKPGKPLADALLAWVTGGAPAAPTKPPTPPVAPPPQNGAGPAGTLDEVFGPPEPAPVTWKGLQTWIQAQNFSAEDIARALGYPTVGSYTRAHTGATAEGVKALLEEKLLGAPPRREAEEVSTDGAQ